jgi:predicted metallopeptidase
MAETLLEVQPSYGTLEPGEHVVMDFKLVANTQPLAIEDRVKIIVREMIRVGNKSKGGMNTKLLEKIRKKVKLIEIDFCE